MARIKGQVQVPQPVVPSQVTGTPAYPDDDKLDKPVQVATESNKPSHIEAASLIRKPKSILFDYRELAAEEGQHEDGPKIDKCPHCGAKFVDMPVWDYREHMVSCEADTNDGASDTSTLSDPPVELPDLPALPKFLSSDIVNGNAGDHDAESDDEMPEPYEAYDASYPETVPLPDADGENDSEQEDLQKIHLPAITDASRFVSSLDSMEEISFEKLYYRVTNAQKALVAWQNEWMDLESYTSDVQPFPPGSTEDFITKQMEKSTRAKVPINPRLPKGFPVGGPEDDVKRAEFSVKYQDQLEASVYGYKWDHRAPRRGDQDPISQRIVESRPDGRDLRQRVPTQKATEGELDTTPESDDENGKRRGRGQRVRYDSIGLDNDSGRGARQRYPSTRVDSISRDQTPVKTFASGKKIGRPRKNPIQAQQSQGKASASRLKELQAEFGLGSPYKNGNVYGVDDQDEDQDVPRQTTELDSRPTSSSSMDSQLGTGPGQDKSSGKGKKRSNTSDFEDALPSNRRIKSNGANGHDYSGGKEAVSSEPNSRSVKMRTIQKESWAKDDGTRKSNLSNSMQERWAQAKKEGRKTLGPSTAAATKKEQVATTAIKSKKGTKVKGEGEPSAASLNMLNRWKKKREALAAGLTPPNIGRYAKAKSATSTTPVATQTPEQSNVAEGKSSAVASAGGKLQGDYSQESNSNGGEGSVFGQIPATGGSNDSAPAKKRGGRPKKIAYSDGGAAHSDMSGFPADESMSALDTASHEMLDDADEADDQDHSVSGKRGPRRKKADGLPSSTEPSSSQTQPTSGSGPTRVSNRVRRPTSRQASAADDSSPASTRHSSRVSGATVTPTPAPAHGLGSQFSVKQEPTNIVIMPKTRRGAKSVGDGGSSTGVESMVQDANKRKRGGHSGPILPTTEFPDTMEFGDGEIDGELAARKRRGGRPKKDNTGSSPAPSDFQTPAERPMARGKSGRFTQSSSSSSTSGGAIVVEDKIPAHESLDGPPNKRRRGGQSTDVADSLPAEGDKKGKGKIRLTLGPKKVVEGEPATVEAPSDVPLDPAEAAALAARKAKSEKMSQIMKARWSRGDMAAVMEQKKANNRARKAAESATPIGFTPPVLTVATTFTDPASGATVHSNGFIAPPSKIRKPTGAAAHKRNQKRPSESGASASPSNITTTTIIAPARKKSEYEVYQDLMSPVGTSASPAGRRAPRTAALKAQQSFSSLNDDENDDEPEEDEQLQIEKQLQVDATEGGPPGLEGASSKELTDYEEFQALASPAPGVVLGKRKRKPVMNLAEAMRMERGDDEESEEDDEEEEE